MKTAVFRVTLLMVALLVSWVAPDSAAAQEHRLTDADVARILPVLRWEVEQARRAPGAVAELVAKNDELERRRESLRTAPDPLQWMRRQSSRAQAPPGARYLPECSRTFQQEGTPKAVFTFGMPLSQTKMAALNGEGGALIGAAEQSAGTLPGALSLNARQVDGAVADMVRLQQAAAGRVGGIVEPEPATRRRMEEVRTFYRAQGWGELQSPSTHNPYWSLEIADPASPGLIVVFTIWEVDWWNVGGEGRPGCPTRTAGPGLAMELRNDLQLEPAASIFAVLPDGMSEGEYHELQSALVLARFAVRHPELFTVPTPPDPEQKAAEAVRRHNIAVFRRHQAVLEPLLATLEGTP